VPIQLPDEELWRFVFLRALGSNTRLVKALPSEYLMAAVSLRWTVSHFTVRADEDQLSVEGNGLSGKLGRSWHRPCLPKGSISVTMRKGYTYGGDTLVHTTRARSPWGGAYTGVIRI
jgi:hypothetical protein